MRLDDEAGPPDMQARFQDDEDPEPDLELGVDDLLRQASELNDKIITHLNNPSRQPDRQRREMLAAATKMGPMIARIADHVFNQGTEQGKDKKRDKNTKSATGDRWEDLERSFR